MDLKDFENVRHQIGCCGAWCGSCVVGNGVLKQLTKKYQEMTDAYGLREWGPLQPSRGPWLYAVGSACSRYSIQGRGPRR